MQSWTGQIVTDAMNMETSYCDRAHLENVQKILLLQPRTGEGWYADLSLLAASLLSAPTRSPIGWRPYCDQNMDTSYRIRKDISYMLQSGHKLQLLVLDEKRQMILFFGINFYNLKRGLILIAGNINFEHCCTVSLLPRF